MHQHAVLVQLVVGIAGNAYDASSRAITLPA